MAATSKRHSNWWMISYTTLVCLRKQMELLRTSYGFDNLSGHWVFFRKSLRRQGPTLSVLGICVSGDRSTQGAMPMGILRLTNHSTTQWEGTTDQAKDGNWSPRARKCLKGMIRCATPRGWACEQSSLFVDWGPKGRSFQRVRDIQRLTKTQARNLLAISISANSPSGKKIGVRPGAHDSHVGYWGLLAEYDRVSKRLRLRRRLRIRGIHEGRRNDRLLVSPERLAVEVILFLGMCT